MNEYEVFWDMQRSKGVLWIQQESLYIQSFKSTKGSSLSRVGSRFKWSQTKLKKHVKEGMSSEAPKHEKGQLYTNFFPILK